MKKFTNTKELFDSFYASDPRLEVNYTKKTLVRQELFDYEKKIGISFINMSVEQIIEMLKTYSINSSDYKLISGYKQLFDFYNWNYTPAKPNPFTDKRFKGRKCIEEIVKARKAYTLKDFERMVEGIRKNDNPDRAKYLECIVQLYFNGFANPGEIVDLTEDMIDFKYKTVYINRRKIQLSDECFDLLVYVHNLKEIWIYNRYNPVISWRGKYFKYSVRKSEKYEFDNREKFEIQTKLSANFTAFKNQDYTYLNYKTIYLLGFYNNLVSTMGKEKANELLTAENRNTSDALLLRLANEYGIKKAAPSEVKLMMAPYVDLD